MTNGDYMEAFDKVVIPIALEFEPSLVIISAGFDAAEGDPIGGSAQLVPRASLSSSQTLYVSPTITSGLLSFLMSCIAFGEVAPSEAAVTQKQVVDFLLKCLIRHAVFILALQL